MADDENFIVCMWHGDLLMQPFNYQNFRPKGTVKAIISEHRDGEAIRKTVEYLGIGSLNGSSTRGGAKVLIGAIKSIKSGTFTVLDTVAVLDVDGKEVEVSMRQFWPIRNARKAGKKLPTRAMPIMMPSC